MFYSETNRPAVIPMPETSKYIDEFEEVLNTKTGRKELKKTGTTNVYEKIQEGKEGAILSNIIKKYKISLDDTKVKVLEEVIEDLTNLPTDLMESLNTIENAKKIYKEMPQEIKEQVGNDYNTFIAAAQSGELEKVIKKQIKAEQEAVKPANEKIEAARAELERLQQEAINNGTTL
ncbi:internal scaffolding protein [Dipodfec virus UOA04_Rod_907]|nr:internal scaffolding protein [Dipodfec virus UOA04_Rod_907]